jgi:PKD repeat protein
MQRDFQTTALFTYAPLNPGAGEEVFFQNLSTNATSFVWNFDDPASGLENTSSEEFPTHTFASDGVYNVQLTASNGSFSATYELIIVVGNLGTSAFETPTSTAIYPNPFSSKFVVKNPLQDANYLMAAIDGKVIYTGKNIEEHDFSDLPNGIYVLTAVNDTQVTQIKIVKR